MMHRFCLPSPLSVDETVRLEGTVARQIRRVLRLKPGEQIGLFCGDGAEYTSTVVEVSSEDVTVRLGARHRPETELRRPLEVGVSLLKGEKLEWVVQKLTELGATDITLLLTERVVPSVLQGRWERRLERCAAIAREAVEQCGRVRLPRLSGPTPFADYLTEVQSVPSLLLHPDTAVPLRSALPSHPAGARLLIGPEGGFSEAEVSAAATAGCLAVSLGRRILRSETAAVAAAALVASVLE